MSDPEQLHAAHVAISQMAERWAAKAVAHQEQGEKEEYRAAVKRATQWLMLARELERLTQSDPPEP